MCKDENPIQIILEENILLNIASFDKRIFPDCLFKMQIGMPITGKYRDPESDQYYNHNDVSSVSTSNIRTDDVFSGSQNNALQSFRL